MYLALFYFQYSRGQNTIGIPQIVNLTNNVYQGGTQTWDIKQDAQGRMYFANNEGLLIYDGSYWKLCPQPNKTMLRSIALYNNRVYAGGQDEIGYYAPDKQGSLQYTSLKNLIPKQYSTFTDVWEIEVFKESVFFRTWDRIFEYKNEAFQIYPAEIGWQIMKKTGNKLIACEKARGFLEFSNTGWQPMDKESSSPQFEVSGFAALNNDTLLVSSLHDGLFKYYKGVLKKIPGADNKIIKNSIYCLEQINNSEFVIGTTSGGCFIINSEGKIIQQIARSEGLQNNNVLSVFIDRDNNLWAGLDNGISFIAYNSAIKYIKPRKPDELSGYSARIYNKRLYIATSNGAYSTPLINNLKDISFSKSEFKELNNSAGQVWHLDEVNGQLLMGHHNGSFLLKQDEAIQLTKNTGAWLFLPTSFISPSQKVLVGTYSGLTKLQYSDNKFIDPEEISGIKESMRFLAIDNSNYIWASHPYRGIYKIRLAPDCESFSHETFTDKNGLPSTLRNNVFRVKNRVVFATEKGIYEFDSGKNRFIRSPLLYKVFGDMAVQYITEDMDGNIWFCAGKRVGVANFTSEKNIQVTYFPELTGKTLAGFENIYPYNNENIFIASNTGIIHLNYKKYIAGSIKPGILLTQVRISGKSDSIIFGGYSLAGNKMLFHFPRSNDLYHFEFSSPAFGLQNNIEYRYQLKGYDAGWSAPTLKTEKEYTNLPDGKYTFLVKAHDNFGHESDITSYSFVITPAWYKTVWAYLLYIMLLVVLFYVVYKWQKRKFNAQQLEFEKEQSRLKYIHQLEMEKNEKEIIQLQNEKLVNEMIYKNKKLADVSMHLVERSDALVKVKDELQRLHKKTGGDHDVRRALQLVNDSEKNNSNWEQFAAHFDEINNDFIKNLKKKFPLLTSTDLKVCTYLQLKLASKEIAQLMNISVRGVEISRYRLRKKLQLPTGQTLNDFLSEIHNGNESS